MITKPKYIVSLIQNHKNKPTNLSKYICNVLDNYFCFLEQNGEIPLSDTKKLITLMLLEEVDKINTDNNLIGLSENIIKEIKSVR